jgi:amino acid adenylation domain
MSQQSELLRRLRQLPSSRREELLERLETVSSGGRTAPLSFRQEQLWLFDRIAQSSTAYGLGFAVALRGPLDVLALQGAVDELADRHTVLRSVFPHDHETGEQQVRTWRSVSLEAEDYEGADREQLRRDVVRAELRRGFDVSNDPVIRFRLLEYGPEDHDLVFVSHALVMDARSAQVIGSDLADAYLRRTCDGPTPSAAPQFSEYVRWQHKWVESPEADATIEFWRDQLSGWEQTELPTDLPRPRLLDLGSEQVHQLLPCTVASGVRSLAALLAVPPEDVLLAAFAALVSRQIASRDLVIGVPFNGSNGFDLAEMVGDAGNLLPIRLRLDDVGPSGSFLDLVSEVHQRRAEAAAQGDLPFKLILDHLGVEPDAGRLPLVQLGFTSQETPSAELQAGDLRMSVEPVDAGSGSFELSLESALDGPEPWVGIRYATCLYSGEHARRLLYRYVALLAALTANPQRRPEDVSLADEQDQERVLRQWNLPIGEHCADTVHELFARVVAEQGDGSAVADVNGLSSYVELDTAAWRVARALCAAGVGPGDLVPVLVERGRGGVAAVLGVLRTGAGYVPIDLGQPVDRVAMVIEDCGARFAVASAGRGVELLGGMVPAVPVGDVLGTVLGSDDVSDPPDLPLPEVSPADVAYVIYTSGSTGRPKGVVVEHRNVTNFVRTVRRIFDLTPADHILQYASAGFDVSVFETFGALLSGASLYVTDENERRSPEVLDRLLSGLGITVIDIPPAILELLTPENYPQLRVAFVGGESFSGDLTTRWARQVEFHNGYGPTETTVTVVDKLCAGEWTSSPPIGRAMDNHRAYVLDETLGLQPPGAVGELAISGLGLARGYLGRPDLTAERFRPDPYGPPGARMYLTGDLAMWNDDGDLVFLGRADRQVKIRGVRIELGEVEAALQSVDGVARAIADVVTRPQRGSLLVGYVVPEPGQQLEIDTIRATVSRRLPAVMVPNVLVPLTEVPLTQSGKIDRRALPAVEFAAIQKVTEVEDETGTATERAVRREVFAPLLGTSVANTVNFFAAGGTSLQAIRVSSRVKAVFGVEVPIAGFFADPTVSGLATLIDAARNLEDERSNVFENALALVEKRSDEEIAALAARFDMRQQQEGTDG